MSARSRSDPMVRRASRRQKARRRLNLAGLSLTMTKDLDWDGPLDCPRAVASMAARTKLFSQEVEAWQREISRMELAHAFRDGGPMDPRAHLKEAP